MKLQCVIRAVHPRHPFRISRAAITGRDNVFVRLEQGGVSGFGEAAPNPYYGEEAGDIACRLGALGPWLEKERVGSVEDIARLWEESWAALRPSRAAQSAFDIALWDLLGKTVGSSVCALATGAPPRPVPTFCTLGLSVPEELEAKIDEVAGFDSVKVKMDRSGDPGPVQKLRARSLARIAVDANCAWDAVDYPRVARDLAAEGVVFVEQPLPPSEDDRMPALLAASPLPVIADESCVVEGDVGRMPGRFAGFSIKLAKCGGLTPALRMVDRGRSLGLVVMVGCMLESGLGIAAGGVVAQRADFADLDGAWLLEDDPFRGIDFRRGTLHFPGIPGFGVKPDPGLARALGL